MSGCAVAPGADDISSVHFPVAHSLLRIDDRDRRAERAAVPDAAEELELVLLEAHARTAAVAEPAARELGRDVVDEDRKARGQPLDGDHEGRTVGLARRQEAQHGVLRSPDARLDRRRCTAPSATRLRRTLDG